MTAPPPNRGGFFVGHTMSEGTEQAIADAAASESSEDLKDTWPVAEPEAKEGEAEPPEGDAEEPEEAEGEGEKDDDDRPRKPSRSERLRRQVERLRAENEALKSVSAPVAVSDEAGIEAAVLKKIGEPPKEADFKDDWLAYDAARQAYEVDRRLATREVKAESERAATAVQQRFRDLAEDYQDNLEKAAKAIPDLRSVLGKSTYEPTPVVTELVLTSGEKAPLVAYHLAQNPKLAARLNAMSPLEAAREIGRIEGKVAFPKPKTATSATPPPSAVKGGASPPRSLGKSMSDYERWRNQ